MFDVMVQVQPLVKDDLKVEWYWICLSGLMQWLLWTRGNGLVKGWRVTQKWVAVVVVDDGGRQVDGSFEVFLP
jgi:hypothetical protein